MHNRMKSEASYFPISDHWPPTPTFYCQVGTFRLSRFLPPDSVQSGRKKNATQTNDPFSGTPNSRAVCPPITFTGSWQDGPRKWPRSPLWSQTAPLHRRVNEQRKHVLRSCCRPGLAQGFQEDEGRAVCPLKIWQAVHVVNWRVLPCCSAWRRASFCNLEEEMQASWTPGRKEERPEGTAPFSSLLPFLASLSGSKMLGGYLWVNEQDDLGDFMDGCTSESLSNPRSQTPRKCCSFQLEERGPVFVRDTPVTCRSSRITSSPSDFSRGCLLPLQLRNLQHPSSLMPTSKQKAAMEVLDIL